MQTPGPVPPRKGGYLYPALAGAMGGGLFGGSIGALTRYQDTPAERERAALLGAMFGTAGGAANGIFNRWLANQYLDRVMTQPDPHILGPELRRA